MRELSKSIARRLGNANFIRRYFVGYGIDIGGKPDPLSLYYELFPLMADVRVWDLEDGDAQYMAGVADGAFDFVHSSHSLEHMVDPGEALTNWLRILKPGGYIIVTLPDEDLYEQGVWPSTFNLDHKFTFTIFKTKSWSPASVNVIELLSKLGAAARVEKIELLNSTYRFDLPRFDQTLSPVGESAIEFIIRKADAEEIENGGLTRSGAQPDASHRIHYNQYRDDVRTLKQGNNSRPPFANQNDL